MLKFFVINIPNQIRFYSSSIGTTGRGKRPAKTGDIPIICKTLNSKELLHLPVEISDVKPKNFKKSIKKKHKIFSNTDENGLPLLSPKDCFRRVEFASKMLEIIENDPDILESIVFTDEGNFRLAKKSSSKGSHEKKYKTRPSSKKSRKSGESQLLPEIVWCGMTSKLVIGPYFFNSYVTDRSYLKMLRTYLVPQLELLGDEQINSWWFQQDGAPPHRTPQVLSYLTKTFGKRLISYGCPLAWPPRSQDLTPLDYFLWENLKDKLRLNCLPADRNSTENFRKSLIQEIDDVDEEVLRKIISQFPIRLQKCITANGERFDMEI